MRFCTLLLLAGLGLGFTPVLSAAPDMPVQVSLTKPQTPLVEVLADLSKQTGTPILTDDTVTAPLAPGDLQAAGLDQMLTTLKGVDAGLVWQKVYLPKDAPLPTGAVLALQARALQTITTDTVLADPAGNVTAARGKAVTPPVGMRLVYLVTDAGVRAQRDAAATAAQGDGTPVALATQGMQSVAETFGQMTPDQQRRALPLMFQQFQRIMQSMDPGVRDSLRQQMGQMGGADPGVPQGGPQ